MDTTQFKHITGEVRNGEAATLRFYGKITESTAARFNEEFDYAESCSPSLIRILINSEGGSVLHGMSVYATIRNSRIPTECINEGMAASMGSVLWAAGTRSLMRDYAILMIHNPFLPSAGDDKASDMVSAFTRQIRTIYRKRFGLTEQHVTSIMDGKAGKDGTYFDAEAAVTAGIIPQGNVLETSPQLCERVRTELASLEDMGDIRSMMSRISAEAERLAADLKPSGSAKPILNRTTTKSSTMSNESKTAAEYSAVAATLGLGDDCQPKDVMARLSELISVEAKFREKEKELSDAKTVMAGKDATIQNLQTNVNELTASLKVYQDKEAQEKVARIEAMLEKARNKIPQEDLPKWRKLAEENPDLVESTLESIPAVEQISREIASDQAGVEAAAAAAKTAEEKMAEKVSKVVGENFEFRSLK